MLYILILSGYGCANVLLPFYSTSLLSCSMCWCFEQEHYKVIKKNREPVCLVAEQMMISAKYAKKEVSQTDG